MIIRFSKHANDAYEELPVRLRRAVDKQMLHLARDLRHPSLRAKKYDESQELWQARINQSWRFYFLILRDVYYIMSIRKHSK